MPRGKSSGAGDERSYFGNPPLGKTSVATALDGSHEPPRIARPSGQKRVILDVPAGDGNAAGAIFAFRIGGSGVHREAFPEHTEANVHDGTDSRFIRMPPPRSRDTFAVWPRFRS